MKYFISALILLSSITANSNTQYMYNPKMINLFYQACNCPISSTNIKFCSDLIIKVGDYQKNRKLNLSSEELKALPIVAKTQFMNDIRYYNRDGHLDLSCFNFTDEKFQHNIEVVDLLKEFESWRE